jgi:uncharacterized iron-regulated membrane protein
LKLLSAIHRWAGGFLGLLLALLGLTGAILVWEGSWVALPGASDPLAEDVGAIASISDAAAAQGDLSRITFASDEIGLHLIVYADGSGAYARQTGEIVDSWSSMWGRPELWIFDLHHYLFAGPAGQTITGLAGIAGLLFVITGVILWWRSRRAFAPRLWPQRMAPGPIVRHHRDLGLIVAPVLTLSLVTGVLMNFQAVESALFGEPAPPRQVEGKVAPAADPVRAALFRSKWLFPDAALRRLSLPAAPGEPIVVRMKQQFEWTPNGRTTLSFDSATGALLSVSDPAANGTGASLREKVYPVHSAKVGGLAMRLAMTVSGLSLALLGGLATWSFWFRRAAGRSARRRFARARAAIEAA